MPAPILRHYKVASGAANTAFNVTGVVPPNRALVVSKVIAASGTSASQNISLFAGVDTTAVNAIAYPTLAGAEIYTESAIVLLAGESLFAMTSGTATQLIVSVFGQEVDN